MSREDLHTRDEAGAAAWGRWDALDDVEHPDPADCIDDRPSSSQMAAAFMAQPLEVRQAQAAKWDRDRAEYLQRLDDEADARYAAHRARVEARRG